MAAREEFIGGVEEWRETDSDTNAAAVATRAAEVGKCHYITGFSASASGTLAASVILTLAQDGGATVRRQFQLPASMIMPIINEFKRVIRIPENTDVTLTLPDCGAGITGRVELLGFTRNV